MVKHLKGLKILKEDFPEHNVGNHVANCTEVIRDTQEAAYDSVVFRIKLANFDKYKQCIVSDLKSHNWAEQGMEQAVILMSESISEQENNLIRIQRTNNMIIQGALELCVNMDLFGSLFDKMFSESSSSEEEDDDGEDPMSDYCTRKYVVEHNLVDKKVYKVIVNPTNLNVRGVNCETILEASIAELRDAVTAMLTSTSNNAETLKCREHTFVQSNFIDKMMALDVLSELNLTSEQKSSERTRFIEFISNHLKVLIECKTF